MSTTRFISLILCTSVASACDLAPGADDGGASVDTDSTATSSDVDDDDSSDAETGGDDESGGEETDGDDTGATLAEGPSCDGLTTQCAGESCCAAIALPGGEFAMGRGDAGSDACPEQQLSCFIPEQPEHDVHVDPFALDKYKVTVGRYRQFLSAWNDNWRPEVGDGAHPAVEGTGWMAEFDDHMAGSLESTLMGCPSWTDEPGGGEDLPITCMTWYHAQAFCIWDGGRLPTEAEWEYAAAGGDDDRLFPWGASFPDETRMSLSGDEPVGSYPKGEARWGHLDMAGNTDEWVFDCWSEDFYGTPAASGDNPVVLPTTGDDFPCGPTQTSEYDGHVTRGGGSEDYVTGARAAWRFAQAAASDWTTVGFRCARDL